MKLSPLGSKPDWTLLDAFARSMSRAEFEKAWREIYSQPNSLPPPFEITQEALLVPGGQTGEPPRRVSFQSAADSADRPAPPGFWRSASRLPPLQGRPVLSDLVIALDPGHLGGQWAAMEERLLSFQPGEDIREGDLSLLTARVLKQRLTDLGAIVHLVRENAEPVTSRRPQDFDQDARQLLTESGFASPTESYLGLVGDAKLLTVQWQREKLFYRVSEIHARGGKVNHQIRPDIVLCLHYNAESWGDASAPQFSPLNHLHTLVNGCYANSELMQQDVRFEMLMRLFGRVHEEELPLASAVAEGMARSTTLPPYVYTTPNARRVNDNPYVYARNLLANRLYLCPVVYLEPYVMNHEETYRRLLAGHYHGRTLIGGRLVSSAIEDYARGVVDGLVKHYQKHRRNS
ncbi:MAG: hypothetical protein CJBNEKGG_03954 [Prosthecobacter sp.]|nr:hypothetical protein [Prosthecobacter sp.]